MMKDKKLLEVSMMLGDAIKKLDALSAYKPDPYAHLKEAHDKGEMVQHQSENGKWHNCIHSSGWAYNDDPDRYRIKPKTKTLYKWAFRHSGKWWKETECFYATKEDAANSAAGLDALGRNEIVRMDATAIEVEA
jgi:hypothetical protein